ncbi:unnamed protein product [Mytilus edulis]|uniref:Uncharacterized protein n=1 Tax=Mytilus edulis TaxID=6550 RepID=A0A8S3RNK3_MYTED|nr:unnamed protein product [Mytilus edulis]
MTSHSSSARYSFLVKGMISPWKKHVHYVFSLSTLKASIRTKKNQKSIAPFSNKTTGSLTTEKTIDIPQTLLHLPDIFLKVNQCPQLLDQEDTVILQPYTESLCLQCSLNFQTATTEYKYRIVDSRNPTCLVIDIFPLDVVETEASREDLRKELANTQRKIGVVIRRAE